MGKNRHNKALWDYLEASGVLDSGSDEAIKVAKRAYRKQYLLSFKRKQRTLKAEYSINFSKVDGEYQRIERAATKHNLTVTAFVRMAALAYLDRTYLVPNREQVARLEQYLADCLNEVKTIVHTKEKFFWERERKLETIEKRIEKMEAHISEALRYPMMMTPEDESKL